MTAQSPLQKPKEQAVFLNIPYDPQFTRQYLAYITALSAMSLVPRATLGITGNRRLDRIATLADAQLDASTVAPIFRPTPRGQE